MPRLMRSRVRRGFTMVELLITIIVLAVIGTLLATTMLGQQRFFQRSYEMVGVRRELRSAMSMVPVDLRGLSSIGGDVIDFNEEEITFRATVGSSIVCERIGGSTIVVPPLDLANGNTLTAWTEPPIAGDEIFLFDEGALRGAEDDAWRQFFVQSSVQVTDKCVGAPFTDASADAGKPRWELTLGSTIPATVIVGAGLRMTRNMQYALTQSDETDRWYLTQSTRRGGTWGDPVYMSGPYEALGLRLVYFDSLGTEIAPGGAGDALSRIDLSMKAAGLTGSGPAYIGGDATPRDSIAFRIAIRNRQ